MTPRNPSAAGDTAGPASPVGPGTSQGERSDAPRRRVPTGLAGYVIIGVVVAAAALGWAVVIANWSGSPGVAAQVIAYRITGDDAVELTYEIAKPARTPVRCVLVAYDDAHAEVARDTVLAPAGTGHVTRTQSLPTSARATAVEIRDCRNE